MANDASLEGVRLSYWRGCCSSVILPHTMIADTKDNFIACLAEKLLNTPGGWSKAKERMRQHLEQLTRNHGDVRMARLPRLPANQSWPVLLG